MKKRTILIYISWLVLFQPVYVFAQQGQNLVPDPGFEIFDKEKFFCNWSYEVGEVGISNGVLKYWWQPTRGSADLWSSVISGCELHPEVGGQKPVDGYNFLGIVPRKHPFNEKHGGKNYREYASTKLITPLVPGKTYQLKMYVSLPNTADYICNNLGMLLSTQPVDRQDSSYLIPLHPQVMEKEMIKDTVTWHEVSKCIVADSAYSYLTVGTFYDSDSIKWQDVIPAEVDNSSVRDYYYFIDYVTVIETVPGPETVRLPADTTLCPGEKLLLDVSQPGDMQYLWQDGSTEPQYEVSRPDYYYVEVSSRGVCPVVRDTIRVTYWKEPDLGPDTLICNAETLVLDATNEAGKYRWNTGANSAKLEVNESGLYKVEVFTSSCILSDSVYVQMIDCPGKVPNVFTPNGDGFNDTFYIENVEYGKWELKIYNRWGKLIYQNPAYKNEWTAEGISAGVYYYELSHSLSGKVLKGWVSIVQ
jgi:gliding motility-associated-like protein